MDDRSKLEPVESAEGAASASVRGTSDALSTPSLAPSAPAAPRAPALASTVSGIVASSVSVSTGPSTGAKVVSAAPAAVGLAEAAAGGAGDATSPSSSAPSTPPPAPTAPAVRSQEGGGATSRAGSSPGSSSAASSDRPSALEVALQELTGETSLARVRYAFTLVDQKDAKWLVSHVGVTEDLSALYAANAELVSVDGADFDKLLGASCTLLIERKEAKRHLHGIISGVSRGARSPDAVRALVTIVPALAALEHRTDTRVFGGGTDAAITIPDVLKKVLESGLGPYKRKVVQTLLRAEYPKREYITQYRESDLEFVHRLMAEEGIWYYFDHESDSDREVLVLVDSNDSALEADLGEDGNELPLQLDATGPDYWQQVTSLARQQSLGTTGIELRRYNWTNPERERTPKKSLPKDSPGGKELGPRAKYDPQLGALWDYSGGDQTFRKFDTDEQARLRWEYESLQLAKVTGDGNLVALCPGQKVKVKGHPEGLDGNWLITRVAGGGTNSTLHGGGAEAGSGFGCSFECVPYGLPFRPERQAKPKVSGIQTAVVVGSDGKPTTSGDDIHTDPHGRVQVKFHWDRTEPGEQDATRTSFLRVAQMWGGSGWGSMFIPRIGMEVVVSFIDGDPDKPLVTGCVYNGLNKPFHKLPDEKTKSYLRTSSSPGNEGFNELLFEDKKGEEQVYLHAQKDLKEEVENAHSLSIKATRAVSVGGNETYTISGKRTKTVGGKDEKGEAIEIHGDRLTTISKNETFSVTEHQKHTIGKGRDVTVSEGDDNLTVAKGHKTTRVKSKYTIFSEDQFAISQGASEEAKVVLNKQVHVETTGSFTLTNKETTIQGAPSGELKIEATSGLTIVCGSASIKLGKDGTLEVSGVKVVVGTKTNNAKFDSAGVALTGAKVSSTAMALNEIKGPMIKIGC